MTGEEMISFSHLGRNVSKWNSLQELTEKLTSKHKVPNSDTRLWAPEDAHWSAEQIPSVSPIGSQLSGDTKTHQRLSHSRCGMSQFHTTDFLMEDNIFIGYLLQENLSLRGWAKM